MVGSHVTDDRIVVTAIDLASWRDEEKAAVERIQEEQKNLDKIRRKIQAAVVLYEELKTEEPSSRLVVVEPDEPEFELEENESLIDAVLRVLQTSGKPMSPGEIKDVLANEGVGEDQLGNYFYTVLVRLKHRGNIVKRKKKYSAIRNKESETADDTRGQNGSSAASS